jgi:ligand-binding sensor domain-containing protein
MIKYLLPLLSFLLAHTANAQLYNFKNFSIDQGVPEARISSIGEDQRGNLWIATLGGGLLQFDGYSFHNYLEDDGLINNLVHAVLEDNSGKLWIGTELGLCSYDGKRFSLFSPLGNAAVNAIFQDASGILWFATNAAGIYRFDGRTLAQFSTRNGLIDNAVNCVYQDKRSTLWIGTTKGLGKYNGAGFEFYTHTEGLASNNVRGISEDNKGDLWIGTDGGISQFNGVNFTNHFKRNGLPSNDIHALLRDDNGNLWFGTSGGISKFDGQRFEFYNANTGQGNDVITSVYQDSEGNLWFGSSEHGLSKLDSERFIHFPENDQMGKRVYALIQAINGNIICGTSLGGTTVFDGREYKLVDGIEGFTSSIVQSFYYTPDSTLWVGTQDEGAFKFSKSRLQQYTVKEGLASNNITDFALDAYGNMWMASADSGVSVMTFLRDTLHILRNYNVDTGLSSRKISSLESDKLGNIWIGTEDAGVDRINIPADTLQAPIINHFSTQEGLTSNFIHTIIADSLNNVYIGTARGVSIYNGNHFFKVSKSDGLGANNIYSLTLDNAYNLWAGTERGVDRISFDRQPSKVSIRHYGTEEGFKGVEVYRNSSCKDRQGNIWFGTVNGLVKYNEREEPLDKAAPKIFISEIKLFFDKIEDTPYADSMSAWYNIPPQLTLPYNQNNLSFSFIGIHHRNPQAVRYKWILEGFSKDWSPPLPDREATFSNLPPGNYTFKVLACNEYNLWTETPAAFTFKILQPFWEQWWVKLTGVATLILIIWLIYYQRLKRVQAKNKVIQEKLEMEKSILELEQEAARLQMNPHFIFNSLNSIQGFIATNDPFQAKRYLAKFARLMRLILENAREEFIPLKNEMDILENYLELEKLSTNNKFDFSITTSKNIDPEHVEIPPMMIQPFVENAIIHGIKKKEGAGHIRVHFEVRDTLIICSVTDNGIGRKKSGSMNGQSEPNHKSTAISVTRRRLEQYGAHRHLDAGIEFLDLEEAGNPIGTKVVISIPFEAY